MLYPPRRGFFFVWGWLFWFWALWAAFKAVLYFAGAVLLLVAWMLAAVWDLATYRHRIARWEEGSEGP